MVIVFEHVSHTVDFKERGALTLTETTAEVCDFVVGRNDVQFDEVFQPVVQICARRRFLF